MTAAILCGGRGTRLRSVIGEHQKCAIVVGGRPWIHRVLDMLFISGAAERVFLLTGYKSEEIEEAAGAWTRSPPRLTAMEVSCLRSKPSGTEAALQLAFATTKEKRLLVLNGDTLVAGFRHQRQQGG